MRFFNLFHDSSNIIGLVSAGLLLIVAYIAYRKIQEADRTIDLLAICEAMLINELDELKKRLDRLEDDGK